MKWLWTLILLWEAVSGCGDGNSNFLDLRDSLEVPRTRSLTRFKRSPVIVVPPRLNCNPGDDQPVGRLDTADRLIALRRELERLGLSAFIIPSGDSHQSEYIAESDRRLKWVSGFSGSNGFAVVTMDKAAMWTDGR